MEFGLDPAHVMLKKLYADFAHKEVQPLAAEIDEEERFPTKLSKRWQKWK